MSRFVIMRTKLLLNFPVVSATDRMINLSGSASALFFVGWILASLWAGQALSYALFDAFLASMAAMIGFCEYRNDCAAGCRCSNRYIPQSLSRAMRPV